MKSWQCSPVKAPEQMLELPSKDAFGCCGFCHKGTLIFFVRKNLRHIFFCDGLGSIGSGSGVSGSGCDHKCPLSGILRGSASVLKMLHLCNIGYGHAIAINVVIVRVQRQLCYGFVFEKKAKSVTFSICVCGGSESLGKRVFVLTESTFCPPLCG